MSRTWVAILLLAALVPATADAAVDCDKGRPQPVGPDYDYCLFSSDQPGAGSSTGNRTSSLARAAAAQDLVAGDAGVTFVGARERYNASGPNSTEARDTRANASGLLLFRTAAWAEAGRAQERNTTRQGTAQNESIGVRLGVADSLFRGLALEAGYEREQARNGACSEGARVEARYLADGAKAGPRTACALPPLWDVPPADATFGALP
ncbi:MAG TPA: hypothetical protein VHH36_04490 [Candidatus Thermoplasmatota archaeon]|nr:hypothetical protein [Candidatus Thermoplasmatota archaeon]